MSQHLPGDVVETLVPFVGRGDLERVRVMTGVPWEWLPWLLRTGAVTLGDRVFFRKGRYGVNSARGLALIAHESLHTGQYREMGRVGFLLRYLLGLVQSRFNHDAHPMEAELVALQRRVRRALREAGLPDR